MRCAKRLRRRRRAEDLQGSASARRAMPREDGSCHCPQPAGMGRQLPSDSVDCTSLPSAGQSRSNDGTSTESRRAEAAFPFRQLRAVDTTPVFSSHRRRADADPCRSSGSTPAAEAASRSASSIARATSAGRLGRGCRASPRPLPPGSTIASGSWSRRDRCAAQISHGQVYVPVWKARAVRYTAGLEDLAGEAALV